MKKLIPFFLIFIFSACSYRNYDFQTISNQKFESINPKAVKIFYSLNDIPENHIEIGYMDISNFSEADGINKYVRMKAAEIGGNGVIQIEEKKTGTRLEPYRFFQLSDTKKYIFKIIRFGNPEPMPDDDMY